VLNGLQHLPHLISLGHSFIILDIDARISLPWRFIDPMTTALLSRLSKIIITDSTKVLKTNPYWITAHYYDQFFDLCHINMIPLLVLLSRELLYTQKDGGAIILGARNRYSVRIGPQFAALPRQAGAFSPLDVGGF